MATRLTATSSASKAAAVAALCLIGLIAAGLLGTLPVGGRDLLRLPGAQPALDGAAQVEGSDESSGIRLSVLALYADGILTAVQVEASGGEDLGDSFAPTGSFVLIDATGAEYRLTGGSPDPAAPRRQTMIFDPIAATAGTLELRADAIIVTSSAQVQSELNGGPPADVHFVNGKWRIRFDWDGSKGPATVHELSGMTSALGNGYITLERVTVAGSGVKVEGFIQGFDFAEIPNFMLKPSVMGTDGEMSPAVAIRGGFGEQRERFEARFAPTSFPIRVRIEATVRPVDAEAPPNTTRPVGLGGASAEFTIEP